MRATVQVGHVDQPSWVRVRVVWHPRRLVVGKRVCWAIGSILDEGSLFALGSARELAG